MNTQKGISELDHASLSMFDLTTCVVATLELYKIFSIVK